MKMGIYKIKNKLNGKVYIGSSNDIKRRWSYHKWTLSKGKHHSKHLQRSYNKNGADSFSYKVIELVEKEDDLLDRENYYFKLIKPYKNTKGYNVSKIAGRTVYEDKSDHPRYGQTFSKEQRKRMSDSVREWYKNNGNPNLGAVRSKETRQRMSLAKKGKVYGKNNNFFGKTHTKESREKMSRSRQGMYVGERNTKAKLTENDVREIRRLYSNGGITLQGLGDAYGVSKSCIMYITTRRSWKHVK